MTDVRRTALARLLALSAIISACSGANSSSQPDSGTPRTADAPAAVCVPGESRVCACPNGRAGAQTCNAQGTGLGPCSGCETPDAGAPISDVPQVLDVPQVIDVPTTPRVCTPGETRACACPNGRSGAQRCNNDGTALEACLGCEAPDAGPPPPRCGDGICNNGELCSSCPEDCGACGTVCGNANYAVPCGTGLCPSFSVCVGNDSCECVAGYRFEECPGLRCDTETGRCGWCVRSAPDAGTPSCREGFDWNGTRCAASAGSQFSGFNGLWPRGAIADWVAPVSPVSSGGQSRLWEYFHQRPGSCTEALVLANSEVISGIGYRFFTRPANLPPALMGTRVPCVGDNAAIGGDGRSLLMRTGVNGQRPSLWWRAPAAGRYEISVAFSFPVATRNVTTAFVYGPVTQQLFRQVASGPTLTYGGTANLGVGQAIAFEIESSSGYRGDVGISATIFPL